MYAVPHSSRIVLYVPIGVSEPDLYSAKVADKLIGNFSPSAVLYRVTLPSLGVTVTLFVSTVESLFMVNSAWFGIERSAYFNFNARTSRSDLTFAAKLNVTVVFDICAMSSSLAVYVSVSDLRERSCHLH